MRINFGQKFSNRQEISDLVGGDPQKGIAKSAKTDVILLFTNSEELYTDYFYPKNTYQYCMYTGIGRRGHQDSPIDNNMYDLNMDVMTHKKAGRHLLVFEKLSQGFRFIGEFVLLETHQNVQPDDAGELRRVFVFHLKNVADYYDFDF